MGFSLNRNQFVSCCSTCECEMSPNPANSRDQWTQPKSLTNCSYCVCPSECSCLRIHWHVEDLNEPKTIHAFSQLMTATPQHCLPCRNSTNTTTNINWSIRINNSVPVKCYIIPGNSIWLKLFVIILKLYCIWAGILYAYEITIRLYHINNEIEYEKICVTCFYSKCANSIRLNVFVATFCEGLSCYIPFDSSDVSKYKLISAFHSVVLFFLHISILIFVSLCNNISKCHALCDWWNVSGSNMSVRFAFLPNAQATHMEPKRAKTQSNCITFHLFWLIWSMQCLQSHCCNIRTLNTVILYLWDVCIINKFLFSDKFSEFHLN